VYHAQEGEQRVSVGDVDEKRLRRELAKVRTRLERRPHAPSWREFEPMARVLHWLGDPQAAGYLRRAADRAPRAGRGRRRASWCLAVGNYYRLAGDHRPAGEWLERAHGAIVEVPSNGSSEFTYKTDSAYLLGRYEEVAAIGERWGNEHVPMVALSRARLWPLTQCSHARWPRSFQSTFGVTDWASMRRGRCCTLGIASSSPSEI
jgi:hypothetical protein